MFIIKINLLVLVCLPNIPSVLQLSLIARLSSASSCSSGSPEGAAGGRLLRDHFVIQPEFGSRLAKTVKRLSVPECTVRRSGVHSVCLSCLRRIPTGVLRPPVVRRPAGGSLTTAALGVGAVPTLGSLTSATWSNTCPLTAPFDPGALSLCIPALPGAPGCLSLSTSPQSLC